jgi:hypothetical protein
MPVLSGGLQANKMQTPTSALQFSNMISPEDLASPAELKEIEEDIALGPREERKGPHYTAARTAPHTAVQLSI